MNGISSQFWGEMKPANWIVKALETLPSLKNKKYPTEFMLKDIKEASLWVIGPKEGEGKKLFLYAHIVDQCSVCKEIFSIEVCKNKPWLMVQCKPGYLYKLPYENSASTLAKKLDMLVHGAYTDVALIHLDEILDILEI